MSKVIRAVRMAMNNRIWQCSGWRWVYYIEF